jgi:Tfp pilus assembly protein FimV
MGVRLTRRGRIVVVCAAGLAFLGVLWLGARHGARATSSHERPARPSLSVVAGPHDTLWAIAVRTRPGADPRVTVQRMIDLNGLNSGIIQPGQRLYVPSR